MNMVRKLFMVFILIAFLAGAYFYVTHEGFNDATATGSGTSGTGTGTGSTSGSGTGTGSTSGSGTGTGSTSGTGTGTRTGTGTGSTSGSGTGTGSTSGSGTGTGSKNTTCPDMLVKRDGKLMMYNTRSPLSDTNPHVFSTLDEYTKFTEQLRVNGRSCPVLFLQEETNTQGQDVLRARPSPTDLQGGLPRERPQALQPAPLTTGSITPYADASRANELYNTGLYPGFDPSSQYQGKFTTLDEVHNSTMRLTGSNSENPMDPNWGGVIYTHDAVASGKYKDNEVVPPSQSGPFVEKSDNVHQNYEPRNIFA